jgi:hypothetical protein
LNRRGESVRLRPFAVSELTDHSAAADASLFLSELLTRARWNEGIHTYVAVER